MSNYEDFKKAKQLKKTKIIGAIVLTCAVALFVFWPVIFKSGGEKAMITKDMAPALDKNHPENIPPPPTTGAKPGQKCIPPDKALRKQITAEQRSFSRMEAQLKELTDKVNASKAVWQAADPSVLSKAKMGQLQGAYEYRLGRYEQFRARYDEVDRALREKVAKYNAQAHQYNVCTGALTGT